MQLTPHPLRVGILGCGRSAEELHLPAIEQAGSVCCVALCDSDPFRLEALAGRTPAPRRYTEVYRFLADPDIDAVAICTPPAHHAALAVAALRAGKHLLVEKPLALTLTEAAAIADAAHQADRIAGVGFHLRCHPLVVKAKAEAAAGTLGRITAVRILWTSRAAGSRSWLCRRSLGGGALFDLGSHAVDLARFLLDDDIDEASARTLHGLTDDEWTTLSARLSRGAFLEATLSLNAADRFEVELTGTDGYLRFSPYIGGSLAVHPGPAFGGIVNTARQIIGDAGAWVQRIDAARGPHPLASAYRCQWEIFAAAVAGQGAPAAALADGIASLAAIEKAVRDLPVPPDSGRQLSAEPREGEPAMSVILATRTGYSSIRATVQALRRQTALSRLELVLVVPSRLCGTVDQEDLAAFPHSQVVEVDEVRSIAQANALGVRRAKAPVVALAEDHCFPDPQWAAALLSAHREPYAAVGPAIRNWNPQTITSWCDFIIGYGPWMAPAPSFGHPFLPGHNSSYKRDVLVALGSRLEEMMEAETVLHQELAASGHALVLAPAAQAAHMNYSLMTSFLPVQLLCGRVFAGVRAARWPVGRKLFYCAASPLIPLVRLWRAIGQLRAPGRPVKLLWKLLPLLLLGLTLDGIGQMLGYLFGIGGAAEKLATYEYDRVEHITPEERRLAGKLAEP